MSAVLAAVMLSSVSAGKYHLAIPRVKGRDTSHVALGARRGVAEDGSAAGASWKDHVKGDLLGLSRAPQAGHSPLGRGAARREDGRPMMPPAALPRRSGAGSGKRGGRYVNAGVKDLFDALRSHLDKVETIAESTFSNMPQELRNERLRRAIRAQFAREAVRQMAELVA
jgi:hypothetical protein